MDEQLKVLAELEQVRERATGLIRAKLAAIAEQLRDAAVRAESDLDVVVPPDPEAFFPLAQVAALIPRPVELPPPAPKPDVALWRALDAGRSQSEILHEMLRRLEPWCGPRAIVVFRDGRASGWTGDGMAEAESVKQWQGDVATSVALARAQAGAPFLTRTSDDALLADWLPECGDVLVVPMSLRGAVVGALLAGSGASGIDTDAVCTVTFVTGLLLETLSVRPHVPTPALAEVGTFVAAEAKPAVVEEEVAVVEAEEAVAVREEVAEAAPTVAPMAAAEAVVEEISAADEESAVDYDASATVQVPVSVPAAAVSAEDERRHEEAKRFARLLVSEIRLYNEQAVVEGKQGRDIYQRLKEDIDRSREMYEQRVPAEVRAESNYFFEELVRILADGDADALGL